MENKSSVKRTFRKSERIRSSKEISDVIKNGTLSKCHFFNLYSKKNSVKRIGLIVKKFQKGTSKRNKIKRRLKEIYRNNKELFKYDNLIVIKKNPLFLKYSKLENEIITNLKNKD